MTRLSPEEVEEIAEAMVEKLAGSKYVDRDRHWDEHEYIRALIEQDMKIKLSRERIREKIVGGLALTSIIAVCGWVGHALITTIATYVTKIGGQ